jgi:ubiquinone/menaquinone biosynthesis C-methylase UbiE
MQQLPFCDRVFPAAVAFYSVHNVTRAELRFVLVEAARVLKHRGSLLVATHLGEGEVYTDTFLGHDIPTTGGTLYSEQQVMNEVSSSGFEVEASEVREPLAHEHSSRRIYLVATRTD